MEIIILVQIYIFQSYLKLNLSIVTESVERTLITNDDNKINSLVIN